MNAVSDLYRAIERQRNWVPVGEVQEIFRKWTTVCGRRLYAEDYGYRAWRMTIRRSAPAQKPKSHDRFRPIESARQLKGALLSEP